MAPLFLSALVTTASLILTAQAQNAIALTGTWSTKSNTTFTGSGFYNYQSDRLIEPSLTGISYSFTSDGYYEEAYYRAIANPVEPSCPQAIMQWQHGTYSQSANGSLTLTPLAVDGRQLLSNPCAQSTSTYTRYNQSEYFQWYQTLIDPYHKIPRLNLYQFDGSPMQPMYQVSTTPDMLPTTTLSPITSTSTAGHSKRTAIPEEEGLRWASLKRRDFALEEFAMRVSQKNRYMLGHWLLDADRWWWIGVGLTGVGSFLYFCF